MIRNKLLISHFDLDGIASIFLGYYYRDKLGFDDFMSEDYGFEEDKEKMDYIKKFRTIVFSDLSVPEEVNKELEENGSEIIYFDHHASASFVKDYKNGTFDENFCGTKLFWDNYVKHRVKRFPVIVEEFVDLVDTYDLWKQDSPLWETAKNLNSTLYGIKNYSETSFFEQNEPFFRLMENKFKHFKTWKLTDKEERIIEKAKKREEYVYNKAKENISYRIDEKDRTFGVFAVPSKISLVASRILEEEPELDYLVVVNTWGGVTGRVSFRSKEKMNCNDIGAANGHDSAAGGNIGPDLAVELLNDSSLVFTYNEEYNEEDSETWLKRLD